MPELTLSKLIYLRITNNYMAKIDTRSLLSLEKYIVVLVENYPQQLRAVDLAKKTDSTKPAITKIKNRLVQICDLKSYAFNRSFVLSPSDDVLVNLFLVFAANKHHKKFLSSRFVKAFFDSKTIHKKIIADFPLYSKYFSESDTGLFINLILENISNIDSEDFSFLMKALKMKPSAITDGAVMSNIGKLFQHFEFTIQDQEKLKAILSLRDRFFFLIRDSMWVFIENMKILQTLNENERHNYTSVYKNTIDFYLRQIFEGFNEPILEAARKSSLRVGSLMEVGSTVFLKLSK